MNSAMNSSGQRMTSSFESLRITTRNNSNNCSQSTDMAIERPLSQIPIIERYVYAFFKN